MVKVGTVVFKDQIYSFMDLNLDQLIRMSKSYLKQRGHWERFHIANGVLQYSKGDEIYYASLLWIWNEWLLNKTKSNGNKILLYILEGE